MPPKKQVEEVPEADNEVEQVPQNGYGKFEYVDQTLYVGEWKLLYSDVEGEKPKKVKHGQGKIMFSGTINNGVQVGEESYEGEWFEDQMHGQGTYKFTSGNVFVGQWNKGVMHGFGKMTYSDGSVYEGNWKNNLMDGDGVYIDADQITWQGIFVEGQFDSKIQKKLQAEKVIKDKIAGFEEKARNFFTEYQDKFANADKKTYKDHLGPYYGNNETCIDYVNIETFPKYEDKPADKWAELLKAIQDDPTLKIHALSQKDDATMIQPEQILVDQLKQKPGGQLVEISSDSGKLILCQLANESWVLVYFSE